MEEIRSFIAIELPREIKLAIARLQDRLKLEGAGHIKWVDPENTHLTLKFLGSIATSLTGRITTALEEACRDINPFVLELGAPGVFPNERRVRVVWVGLKGDIEMLGQLQKRIDTVLVPLGFSVEDRPFTPHLTLARVREQAALEERQSLGQLVTGTVLEGSGSLNVDAVYLMRSQLTREGPIYSRISTVMLKQPVL